MMNFRPAHGQYALSRDSFERAASQNTGIYTQKGIDKMTAFVGEFIFEAIRFVVLAAVALAAIFCGKKLRDGKDAKKAAENQSGK